MLKLTEALSLSIRCEEPTHWKDFDAGKDWKQEKKRAIENETFGWHHWLNGCEFEQTLEDDAAWDMVVVEPPEPSKPLKLQTEAPSKAKPYSEKKVPDENPNRAGQRWGDEGKTRTRCYGERKQFRHERPRKAWGHRGIHRHADTCFLSLCENNRRALEPCN